MSAVDWMDDAACQGESLDLFFPEDSQRFAGYGPARVLCAECPVVMECRDWNDAVERRIGYRTIAGFYAGESPNERRRRRRGLSTRLAPPDAVKDVHRRLVARFGGGRAAAYAYAEMWDIRPISAERLFTRLRKGFAGRKVFDRAETLDAS